MVQWRVVELWRQYAAGTTDSVDWAERYRTLLAELDGLHADGSVPEKCSKITKTPLVRRRDPIHRQWT
jgi:hypothetical protein